MQEYLNRYFSNETLYYWIIQTPVGKAIAVATKETLIYLDIGEMGVTYAHENRLPLFIQLEKEIKKYFDGTLDAFTVSIRVEGTIFQKQVYNAIQKIPFGVKVSYQDIAIAISRPKSARAVGSACRHCPISFVIPCHRVINKSGDMGGYGSSIDIKARLLLHEEVSRKEANNEACN